ncbi:ImmA/IrrE family metallo-endopeptidase [Methylobacterium sp. J-067]|uniref:ImmA/IrrE family metallo-endopeptidase n=1 Tax=Methylobacterium sp. J-067 TaxID=2836648 RepID=UPI001FB864CB|nr:ImmA/IrrE family metallo-endopeptidase [Methylobacterium sp. J-067]MCJ2023131.1 ImmA/IrrE family metallo-endopeptidase [Methylobacterium sp. J-067]
MTIAPPSPTHLMKAKVHSVAENVASRLKFKVGDAIEPLVVKLGGRIEYKTAEIVEGNLPEAIIVRAMDDFTIFLPSVTSLVRDRFTIAHELGHLFLHYPLVSARQRGAIMIATRWVNKDNPDLIRTEWEANWFAAAFLMPATEFREIYTSNGRSIELTARHFAVSPKAAEVRAQSLGC